MVGAGVAQQATASAASPAVEATLAVVAALVSNLAWRLIHQRAISPLMVHYDPEMLAFGEGWGQLIWPWLTRGGADVDVATVAARLGSGDA